MWLTNVCSCNRESQQPALCSADDAEVIFDVNSQRLIIKRSKPASSTLVSSLLQFVKLEKSFFSFHPFGSVGIT